MKIVVFDLDDTLYNEMTYVESGFRYVASVLSDRFSINEVECMNVMLSELSKNGRGKIFDNTLAHYGINTKANVQECIRLYRNHVPLIQLYDDAHNIIEELYKQHVPIYIVTDGNKFVQLRKLKALGLYDHPGIKKCFITRRYGLKNEKPSPYCFNKICDRERVSPSSVVYIGDNPNKDFVGIKPLGFKTVRILRGSYANVIRTIEFEADITINNLDELWRREILYGI